MNRYSTFHKTEREECEFKTNEYMANAALEQQKLDQRQVRAWEMLSNNGEIKSKKKGEYLVKSQLGQRFYAVKYLKGQWTCDCPDYINRKVACKHIYAVQLSREPVLKQKKIA